MSGPVAVCRTSELAEAGAFWTHDVALAPVLVVRDLQGAIRAFLNLCRHRGVRLVHERHGVTRSFTCLLHGWTYDTTGQMGGAPLTRLARDNPMLAALRENNALTPMRSELRHGFVWVAPRRHEPLDVAAFLGATDAELAARVLETFELRARATSPIEADAGALLAAVHPSVDASDEVRVLSEDMVLVLHPREVSIFTRGRRRSESDFGESTESAAPDQCTLEHMRLAPPPP